MIVVAVGLVSIILCALFYKTTIFMNYNDDNMEMLKSLFDTYFHVDFQALRNEYKSRRTSILDFSMNVLSCVDLGCTILGFLLMIIIIGLESYNYTIYSTFKSTVEREVQRVAIETFESNMILLTWEKKENQLKSELEKIITFGNTTSFQNSIDIITEKQGWKECMEIMYCIPTLLAVILTCILLYSLYDLYCTYHLLHAPIIPLENVMSDHNVTLQFHPPHTLSMTNPSSVDVFFPKGVYIKAVQAKGGSKKYKLPEFLLAGHTTSTIHINNSLSFLSPSPKQNIISDTSSSKKTTKSTPTSSSKKMKTNYDSTPISTTNAVLSLLMDSREFSDLTSFIDCTTTRDWSSSVLSCEIITFSLHTANHTQLTRLQMHS